MNNQHKKSKKLIYICLLFYINIFSMKYFKNEFLSQDNNKINNSDINLTLKLNNTDELINQIPIIIEWIEKKFSQLIVKEKDIYIKLIELLEEDRLNIKYLLNLSEATSKNPNITKIIKNIAQNILQTKKLILSNEKIIDKNELKKLVNFINEDIIQFYELEILFDIHQMEIEKKQLILKKNELKSINDKLLTKIINNKNYSETYWNRCKKYFDRKKNIEKLSKTINIFNDLYYKMELKFKKISSKSFQDLLTIYTNENNELEFYKKNILQILKKKFLYLMGKVIKEYNEEYESYISNITETLTIKYSKDLLYYDYCNICENYIKMFITIIEKNLNNDKNRNKIEINKKFYSNHKIRRKLVEVSGVEPLAFRVQSGRSTN